MKGQQDKKQEQENRDIYMNMLIHDLRNPCMNVQFGVKESKKILQGSNLMFDDLKEQLKRQNMPEPAFQSEHQIDEQQLEFECNFDSGRVDESYVAV